MGELLYCGIDFFLYKNKIPTWGTISKLITAAIQTNSVPQMTKVLLDEKNRFGMLLTPRNYIILIHSLGKLNKQPKLMIELFNKYWTDLNFTINNNQGNVNINAHSRVIYTMVVNLIHLNLDSVIEDLLLKVDKQFLSDKTTSAIDSYKQSKDEESEENESTQESSINTNGSEETDTAEEKA